MKIEKKTLKTSKLKEALKHHYNNASMLNHKVVAEYDLLAPEGNFPAIRSAGPKQT